MRDDALTRTDRLVLQALISATDKPFHGLTKLHKLLFIAAHPADFGLSVKRPIRSLRFKVYKYGPFCEKLYASIERLVNRGLVKHTEKRLDALSAAFSDSESEDEMPRPRTLHVYAVAADAANELSGTDEVDLRLVKEAAQRWGWLTPGQIEAFVNRRVGLTPELKERFMNTAWDDFVRYAKDERRPGGPEPSEAFWRAEQAFRQELYALMAKFGKGGYAAYRDGKRVAVGPDDARLYDDVLKSLGKPPDFIGYLAPGGVREVAVPAVA